MKPKKAVRLGDMTEAEYHWIRLISPAQRRDALVAAAKKQHADVMREQEKIIEPRDFKETDNGH